jgi:hypothetical protein
MFVRTAKYKGLEGKLGASKIILKKLWKKLAF